MPELLRLAARDMHGWTAAGVLACMAAVAAWLVGPVIEPGPTNSGVLHAAVVGAAVGAASRVALRQRASDVAWQRRGRAAAEHGHDVLWEATPHGMITFVSQAAAHALGYEPEELVGQSVAKVLSPVEADASARRWAAGRYAGSGWRVGPVNFVAKDGAQVVGESSTVAVVNRRGRVVAFTGVTHVLEDASETKERQANRDRIMAVITSQNLGAAAQPIVDLDTGEVIGVEMLTRFRAHPPSPDIWFHDAADVGLLTDLEIVAVHNALAAAVDLPSHLYVSINVSPATLRLPALPNILQRGDIDPARVVLELTEHEPIEDYAPLVASLAGLRNLGVRLAVDDAGAGFSSFRHILRLRPDYIKVDRALVTDIHNDPGRRALAAAIVMFALEMNADVIAEGVETEDELKVLATLGMDAAQGFLLQRPTEDRAQWQSWAQRLLGR